MTDLDIECRDPVQYTYFTQRMQTKVDYFFVDSDLVNSIRGIDFNAGEVIGADHVPGCITVDLPNVQVEPYQPQQRLASQKLQQPHIQQQF